MSAVTNTNKTRFLLLLVALILWTVPLGRGLAEDHPPLYLIAEPGGWGLIDESGAHILAPVYDAVGRYDAEEARSATLDMKVPDDVAIDLALSRSLPFTSAIIPIGLDGNAGFATRDGRQLSLGVFDQIVGGFSDGRIEVHKDGKVGFADESGNLIIPFKFDYTHGFKGGFAFVQVGDKWGVINTDGAYIAQPLWNEVRYPLRNFGMVRIGEKWGIVDSAGSIVVPIQFSEIMGAAGGQFSVAIEDGRYFYIEMDGSGDTAFEFKCPGRKKPRAYPFFAEAALVKCGRKYGLVNKQGTFVLPPDYDNILNIVEGRTVVTKGKTMGIADEFGRFIVPLTSELFLWGYTEGLAGFHRKKTDTNGFFNLGGNVVFEMEANLSAFRHGLAVAQVEVGGRWKKGYIDQEGKWVIPPRFHQAHLFKSALAYVEQPIGPRMKESGYINKDGKVVFRRRFGGTIWEEQHIDRQGIGE